MLDYSYHRLAADELLAVVKWYRVEEREPARAERFYESVARAITHIRQHPDASTQVHPIGVRAKPLDRFAFSIHYLVLRDRVRILAIAHHKRRPLYWIRRLRTP